MTLGKDTYTGAAYKRLLRSRKRFTRYNRCISLDGKQFYGFTVPCKESACVNAKWRGYVGCFCAPKRCTLKEFSNEILSLSPEPESCFSSAVTKSCTPDVQAMLHNMDPVPLIAEKCNVSIAYIKRMAAALRLNWVA